MARKKNYRKTKRKRCINYSKPVASVVNRLYVNVLVSGNTVLIAQMSGFFIHQRYQHAYVFLDHHSEFTYIHQTRYETVEAEEDFKTYAESHGVDTKYCNSNNGIL